MSILKPTCVWQARYMALRDSTVARSRGIISTIRTEPRNSGDTNRRKETWSRVVTISRELVAEETRTRNGGDKDGDLDGKERNKEKRKEMKGCQSYGE